MKIGQNKSELVKTGSKSGQIGRNVPRNTKIPREAASKSRKFLTKKGSMVGRLNAVTCFWYALEPARIWRLLTQTPTNGLEVRKFVSRSDLVLISFWMLPMPWIFYPISFYRRRVRRASRFKVFQTKVAHLCVRIKVPLLICFSGCYAKTVLEVLGDEILYFSLTAVIVLQ